MPHSAQTIAIAEDDHDDRDLTREAFAEIGGNRRIQFFSDGAELLEHLFRCADSPGYSKLPSMILLDLNMPRVDGIQALSMIRADSRLAHLPIVVLSTSHSQRDIQECYRHGANSFITKPARFQSLVEALRGLDVFWFNVASLPK
jgi:CheY-like chemotaxis protein